MSGVPSEQRRFRIRLLVVDRRPVFARGLESLFDESPAFEVVRRNRSADEEAGRHDTDVVLVSGTPPDAGALALMERVRSDNPKAATMMLLNHASPSFITSAHAAGVRGMLLDDVAPPSLLSAVVAVHRGERVFDPQFAQLNREARLALSDREIDVLRLAADGASPHAISRELHISKSTTRTYLSGAIRKMGATNRTDAARTARGLGWL